MERVAIPEARLAAWRRAYHHDQMRPRFGYGWGRLWLAWWIVLGWKSALLLLIGNLPGLRTLVARRHVRMLSSVPADDFAALLDREKPDLLLHPSTFDGYFINDMIAEGKNRHVPTMLLMNSWDNPSIKRATSGKADWVCAWGEQTRQHTAHFMGIRPERIATLGAAQFEVYRTPPRITPGEFRAEHGLPEGRKLLLYAGSSKGSREALHLQWLNDSIEAGDLGELTVVYRPHPWGISQEESRTILEANWPHVVIEASMRGFLEKIRKGTNRGFFMAEYARAHDVLSSVDAVISPLSTIILESALHGLPVMCFFPREEEKDSNWRGLRKLVHFEDMFKSPAVLVASRYASFLPKVRELIARIADKEREKTIVREMDFFVTFHEKGYGRALVDLINEAVPTLRSRE